MVVPSLAALLSDAAGKLMRDFGPLLRAKLADELDDLIVLLLGPRALDELGVEDLLPAVEALDVRALLEILGCWGLAGRGRGARAGFGNYSKFFKRVRGRSDLIGCRGACGGRAPIFFQFLPLYCATARRRMSSCWSRGEVATVSDTPGARREVGRSQGFL